LFRVEGIKLKLIESLNSILITNRESLRLADCKPQVAYVVSIHVANVRPADANVHDIDLDTFHGWFTTPDLSHTDEDSVSSLQSPVHGMTVTVL